MNAAGTNMNCEQYREGIAADPSESFDGGALHAAECSSCTAYKLEIQANIHEKYRRIYRTGKISINGKLTAEVEPNSFLVQYEHGIIELSLALVN